MTDAAARLGEARRDVIKEAVKGVGPEAVARQPLRHGTQHIPGQRPGDPVDEEIRRENEKRFGEPAPKVCGERRLISVAEARAWLGGISPTTFYSLVKEGELAVVKIGSRSFVRAEDLDD